MRPWYKFGHCVTMLRKTIPLNLAFFMSFVIHTNFSHFKIWKAIVAINEAWKSYIQAWTGF